MPLIKNNVFIESSFVHVSDEEALPEGAVVVSLKRFQAERDALMMRNAPLGVRIASDQVPESLGADVHHFALIELEFPKFRDGRGYSSARTLRERMAGEALPVAKAIEYGVQIAGGCARRTTRGSCTGTSSRGTCS